MEIKLTDLREGEVSEIFFMARPTAEKMQAPIKKACSSQLLRERLGLTWRDGTDGPGVRGQGKAWAGALTGIQWRMEGKVG